MTVFSCRLLITPIFRRRLSIVLSKFSHKNNFSPLSHPLDGVTGVVRPLPPASPSDAAAHPTLHSKNLRICFPYKAAGASDGVSATRRLVSIILQSFPITSGREGEGETRVRSSTQFLVHPIVAGDDESSEARRLQRQIGMAG